MVRDARLIVRPDDDEVGVLVFGGADDGIYDVAAIGYEHFTLLTIQSRQAFELFFRNLGRQRR